MLRWGATRIEGPDVADYLKTLQHNYLHRLRADGIPLEPEKRTADEQTTATLEFWAAQSEALLDLGTTTQDDAEVS